MRAYIPVADKHLVITSYLISIYIAYIVVVCTGALSKVGDGRG